MSLACSFPSSSSALSRAILKEQWNRVLQLLDHAPNQAQIWSKQPGFFDGTIEAHVLPLHQVLVQPTTTTPVPISVLKALIEAYPAALQLTESSYERLPLHCACRRPSVSLSLIEPLVQAFPQACLVPDALQRLPLHYALTNGASVPVIQYLLQAQPRAAQGVDIRGFTPLHVACAQLADPQVIRWLLQLNPQALVMASHSGISVRQCLPPSSSTAITTTTVSPTLKAPGPRQQKRQQTPVESHPNNQSNSHDAPPLRTKQCRRMEILQLLSEAQEQFESTNPSRPPNGLRMHNDASVWV